MGVEHHWAWGRLMKALLVWPPVAGERLSPRHDDRLRLFTGSIVFTAAHRLASSVFWVHSVVRLVVRYNAGVPEVKPFRLTESVKAAG
jgi:hypothetical protein